MISRPSEETLAHLLREASGQEVTYREVGVTGDPQLPPGYKHVCRRAVLGHGEAVFRLGVEAITTWQAQRHVGAAHTPPDPELKTGNEVLSTIRLGPVFVVSPCRIVYVTDEEGSFGFAYGTLPGHLARGEESFHVRRGAGGEIVFEVVAFSRPADLLTSLGGPLARLVQAWVTSGYLDGVRRFVTQS